MIEMTCESHPKEPPGALARNKAFNVRHPMYAAPDGVAMLEIRPGDTTTDMWRSEDNGRTWTLADRLPAVEKCSDGR